MNYLTKWYDDIVRRTSLSVPKRLTVEGLHQKHVGPSLQFGRVEMLAEPSTSFEVVVGRDVDQSDETQLFLEASVFGLLDVLLVSETYPLHNVRLTITRLEIDPISSSQMAFRLAGRDAGRKIMVECKRGSGSYNK
jgi:hypothetical protein